MGLPRFAPPFLTGLLLALVTACGPGEEEPDAGMPLDGGLPDAGEDGGLIREPDGPIPLLGRLSPSRADFEARSYDDLFVMDDSAGPLAALNLPHRRTIQLDPEDPASARDVCIHWGILTAGIMALPTVQQTLDLLGVDRVGEARPRECEHVGDPSDIYGCRARCTPVRTMAGGLAGAADLRRHVEALREVRLLHPYMIAYPCTGPVASPTASVTSDRASIHITQFATTGDGFGWAASFEESGGTGDNDVEGADTVWQRAWDLSARYQAYTIWIGDVSFPRRWYPAAPRSADNLFGIRCDTGEASGWFQANDFVGLALLSQGVAAQVVPEEPLPDTFLATYPAMPYMRAMSSAATFLTRFAEHEHPGIEPPRVFSTQGGSKGGMACIYTVLSDPRVQHGVCAVFDALDLSAPGSTMSRFVTDWGLCGFGGIRPDGSGGSCVTGNFVGFPGPQVLDTFTGDHPAIESFRHTWELAEILEDMDRAVPESRIFFLTASTDFHWAAGSNDPMWTTRPPPPDQYRMLLRINGDHGMTHLAPDDAPEGLTFGDWHHGAQERMAYRAFFTRRDPVQVVMTAPPRIEAGRIVASARARSDRSLAGARAWIAASTDRDFSFCTGIELGASAVMCRGEFLCRSESVISGATCPGNATASCAGLMGPDPESSAYLREHLSELNLLPTRRSSGHFCWWRELDGSGRAPAEQCIDPMGVLRTWRIGEELPTATLLREGLGSYGDLPSLPEGANPNAPLPPIFRYRSYGEASAEQLLERWGFVNPYLRDAEGEFVHRDSGFFLPRPVTLGADGEIELSWEIPVGSTADHFAVAIEVWEEAGADSLPDVVFTPIITVHSDAMSDLQSCAAP